MVNIRYYGYFFKTFKFVLALILLAGLAKPSMALVFNRMLENGEKGIVSGQWEVEDGVLGAGLVAQPITSENIRFQNGNYVIRYELNNRFGNNRTVFKYRLPKNVSDLSDYLGLGYQIKTSIEKSDITSRAEIVDHQGKTFQSEANGLAQSWTQNYCRFPNIDGLNWKEISEIRIILERSLENSEEARKDQEIEVDNVMLFSTPRELLSNKAEKKKELVTEPTVAVKAKSIKTKAGVDTVAPRVTSLLFNGKTIVSGDLVKDKFQLKVIAQENQLTDSGVVSWNVEIADVNNPTNKIILNSPQPLKATTPSYEIVTSPATALNEGEYRIKINVQDNQGNVTQNQELTIKIAGSLKITGCLNGPNPFNPAKEETAIQYQLSKDADELSVYIYSIGGKKIQSKKMTTGELGTEAGFNSIGWDGLYESGQAVPNGVYIAYIRAKAGPEKTRAKVKMAVLK